MGQYFANESLNSHLVKHEVKIFNRLYYFYTDNGVFSKSKMDYGSRFLLETVCTKIHSGKVLDVGCGYGTLGICIAKECGSAVDMIDINKRALHLAKRNAKENHATCNIYESNVYENVHEKYNYIITNPPIRAGKKIVYEILCHAKDHLEAEGVLFFVIRKNHGAKSILSDLEKIYDCNVLDKSNGFFVIEAKKR